LIDGSVDGGDLTRTIGVVEGVFDLAGGDAEGPGFVAVDIDANLRAADLQVAGDILKAVQGHHVGLDDGRPAIEFVQVRALDGELIEAFGDGAADANERRILQEDIDAGDGVELATQTLD